MTGRARSDLTGARMTCLTSFVWFITNCSYAFIVTTKTTTTTTLMMTRAKAKATNANEERKDEI